MVFLFIFIFFFFTPFFVFSPRVSALRRSALVAFDGDGGGRILRRQFVHENNNNNDDNNNHVIVMGSRRNEFGRGIEARTRFVWPHRSCTVRSCTTYTTRAYTYISRRPRGGLADHKGWRRRPRWWCPDRHLVKRQRAIIQYISHRRRIRRTAC